MTTWVDEVSTWRAGRCFAITVGVLVAFNIGRAYGLLGPPVVSAGILFAVLILIAWRTGASLADLSLDRRHAAAGLVYGAGAVGLVLLVLLVAAVLGVCGAFRASALPMCLRQAPSRARQRQWKRARLRSDR